ncbi:MAG: transcriptional repressor [Campylobacteraceae bacterium]|nr:transcriptional repressor [Campylobacteraceae bacterium]
MKIKTSEFKMEDKNRTFNKFINIVFGEGKKTSIPRYEVAKILFYNKHLSVNEIQALYEKTQKTPISQSTIYQVINLLEECSFIKSMDINGVIKYELDAGLRHDHLYCTECGKIVEFMDEKIIEIEQNIAKEHGFNLSGHILLLEGICKKCQSQ